MQIYCLNFLLPLFNQLLRIFLIYSIYTLQLSDDVDLRNVIYRVYIFKYKPNFGITPLNFQKY